MKKRLCLLFALVTFMFCTVTVEADVVFEPMDSFYDEHREECEYVDRVFTANGPDGKVILYESPESPVETTTWENGHTAYISYTYTDSRGIQWGSYDGQGESGWMPMEYMEEDNISFINEQMKDSGKPVPEEMQQSESGENSKGAERIKPEANHSMVIFACVIVVFVVLATAGLLVALKKC